MAEPRGSPFRQSPYINLFKRDEAEPEGRSAIMVLVVYKLTGGYPFGFRYGFPLSVSAGQLIRINQFKILTGFI